MSVMWDIVLVVNGRGGGGLTNAVRGSDAAAEIVQQGFVCGARRCCLAHIMAARHYVESAR